MSTESKNNNEETKKAKRKNRIYLHIRDALQCCANAISINPKNVSALYNMGKCLIEEGNYVVVCDIIERIQKIDINSPYISILEGHLSLKKGCLMDTFNMFYNGYKYVSCNDSFLAYGFGMFYDTIENYKLARKWYAHILKLNVELFKVMEITFRLGVCYKKEGQFYDSLECFKWLLNLVKTEVFRDNIKLQMAHAYECLDMNDECIEILDALRSSKRIALLVNRMYTWVHFKNKNYAEIKKQFRCQHEVKHPREAPNLDAFYKEMIFCECNCKNEYKDPYIIYLLARVYNIERKYDMAMNLYKYCTEIDSKTYLAYNSMGVMYYRMKKYDLAFSNFNSALSIKSYFVEASTNAISAHEAVNNINCQEVIESNPNIITTRYIDNQVVFEECICYVSKQELLYIHEVAPQVDDLS